MSSGLSTAVAVFCHELPHELGEIWFCPSYQALVHGSALIVILHWFDSWICIPGDFAVLLTAGMTVKQALFYNFVSALLALLGNFVGIALGNLSSITPWILSLIAGMFLYVALVDMVSITCSYNTWLVIKTNWSNSFQNWQRWLQRRESQHCAIWFYRMLASSQVPRSCCLLLSLKTASTSKEPERMIPEENGWSETSLFRQWDFIWLILPVAWLTV